MENEKVFIVDRCEFLLDAFFKTIYPTSFVEDGYFLNIDGIQYNIEKLDPVGMDVQRDLEFYILKKVI